jgi:hypothetical protein
MPPPSPESLWSGLGSATEPADIISASWIAFECIRLCANGFADQVTDNFAAWVMAGAPACEGRDALGRAPSMPMAVAHAGPLPQIAAVDEDAAAELVGELATLVAQRLSAAARQATGPEDARACAQAAAAAAEIHGLLAGAGGSP